MRDPFYSISGGPPLVSDECVIDARVIRNVRFTRRLAPMRGIELRKKCVSAVIAGDLGYVGDSRQREGRSIELTTADAKRGLGTIDGAERVVERAHDPCSRRGEIGLSRHD